MAGTLRWRGAAGLEKHADHLILHRAPPKSDPCWFGFVITVRPEAVAPVLGEPRELQGVDLLADLAAGLRRLGAWRDGAALP